MKKIFFIILILILCSCTKIETKEDSYRGFIGYWETNRYELVLKNEIPNYFIEFSEKDTIIVNLSKDSIGYETSSNYKNTYLYYKLRTIRKTMKEEDVDTHITIFFNIHSAFIYPTYITKKEIEIFNIYLSEK